MVMTGRMMTLSSKVMLMKPNNQSMRSPLGGKGGRRVGRGKSASTKVKGPMPTDDEVDADALFRAQLMSAVSTFN